jgi:hypothetical protein
MLGSRMLLRAGVGQKFQNELTDIEAPAASALQALKRLCKDYCG